MSKSLILVVDDEPANLAVINEILRDDYRLMFSKSGRDALVAAKQFMPALILMDIQLPDIPGTEVCARLRQCEAFQDTPVIFVTSIADADVEAEELSQGAVDYIVKPIKPRTLKARIHLHLSLIRATRLEKSYREAIFMLGEAGHYNDTDTGVHIWRMAAYSRLLAESVGWRCEDFVLLEYAAPMHDTGKIGIPDTILRKPGKLNDAEWEVMRTHTQIGHKILSRVNSPVFRMAAELALRHHEKWDGSGYPDGLAGDSIPEPARIVAVADVFDALSMKRPYKEPWPVDKIVTTIEEGAGTHFEPRMVEKFKQILPDILEAKQKWDAEEAKVGR